MRIDIAGQIYEWRRVIAGEGLLPAVKDAGMAVMGQTLAHPTAFRAAEEVGLGAMKHLPRAVFANPLNPWTQHREMPDPPAETFHQWYAKNRGQA